MNLPNRITFARICLIPLVMWLLLSGNQLGTLFLFLATSLTDSVDGYIARSKDQITDMGKFLDPLADKLLISAVLVVLVEMGRLASWIAVLIISREFAVTGLRLMAASAGQVIAAGTLGKLKTISQVAAVSLLIVNNYPFSLLHLPLDQILLWVAVLLTVVSGVEYFYKNRNVFQMGE